MLTRYIQLSHAAMKCIINNYSTLACKYPPSPPSLPPSLPLSTFAIIYVLKAKVWWVYNKSVLMSVLLLPA